MTFNGWSDIIDTEEWVSQTWNITIRNASGGKVAERNGVDPDWEDAHWSWKGLGLNGNSVRVGTYAATFTVTNTTTGEIDTARRTLTATSDTIYRRSIKSHRGVNTSARSHSANCYIDPAWYKAGSLELDCWGGREAVARYNSFDLPSGARNVSWSVTGERNCCEGRVNRTGWRTGNQYDVRVLDHAAGPTTG